jgi:ribonuclease HI
LKELAPLRKLLYSAAVNSNTDALPRKTVTESRSPIKLLKGRQKDIKRQWIPTHCGFVVNEIADYLAKEGIKKMW